MTYTNSLIFKSKHAIFGASKHSWLGYSKDKMVDAIISSLRKDLGTEIHEYCCFEIRLGHRKTNTSRIKDEVEHHIYHKYYDEKYDDVSEFGKKLLMGIRYLPKEVYETIKLYINDAYVFHMDAEVKIGYSEMFFGTADTLSFKDGVLRIHDLKTGSTQASMDQLVIYAAFYCLGNKVDPKDISFELSIYQNANVGNYKPTSQEVRDIMDKIISDNAYLENYFKEV